MWQSYLVGIGCSFILSAIIAYFWVRGIDYMKENHPDYTGDDFLNWDASPKKNLENKE